MGSTVQCASWPHHAIAATTLHPRAATATTAYGGGAELRALLPDKGGRSRRRRFFRSQIVKVLACDSPPPPSPPPLPKRETFFPQKLFENMRVRLGFKKGESAPSPPPGDVVDEDLKQELVNSGVLPEEDLSTLKTPKDEEAATSITSDDVYTDVLFEQEEKDIEAEENKRATLTSPGFSFSAAGHLFPYHLGVSQCLIEKGYLTENTPLAGSSAGALVCAVVAGGLEMSDALQAAKEVAHDCRENGTAFRLGAVLRGIMEKYLPEDAHTRVSGRIRIAVTQVFRRPRGLLVNQFDSREDLIDALHTSCFIPGYFAPRPVTMYRNRVCIDGGFTLFMPPTAAEDTIRICAFFASTYKIRGVGISPDCNPSESRPTNQQLLNLAFVPAEDAVLDDMFRIGYDDALCWVNRQLSSP